MKILNIQASNFKSFKEFNFDLKKINVILGPNNSGKSNILKLLLLLKQTFMSSLKSPLILNGNILNLGSYKDITYRFNNKDIGINYQIISPYESHRKFYDEDYEEKYYDLQTQYSFDDKFNIIYLSNVKLNDLQQNKQIIDFQKDKKIIINNQSKEFYVTKLLTNLKNLIKQLEVFPSTSLKRDYPFRRLFIRLETTRIDLKKVSDFKEIIDYFKKVFLRILSRKWDLKVNYNSKFIEFSIYSRELEHFFDFKRILERTKVPYLKKYFPDNAKKLISNYDNFIDEIINIYKELRDVEFTLNRLREGFSTYWERIYYIGPLREYPKRYYPIIGESAEDIGFKGEFLPYLLKKSKEKLDFWDYRLKGLNKWVLDWLIRFEMANEIDIKRYKEINELISIFCLEYFSGVKVNISDMGFGTSQVLPIIVEGFSIERDALLLIEQPEIHLHPKAQSILGDLFIEIANEDKTLIIETHSEHLIRRIQRRIAENKISNKDVIFYYVTIGKEGSQLQRLEIDEEGYIENIPEGFFDEDYKEASEHLRIIAKKKENIK